jgi:transposase InsO family protein
VSTWGVHESFWVWARRAVLRGLHANSREASRYLTLEISAFVACATGGTGCVGDVLAGTPWRGLDDVEFATMTYVDWFNHRRLHGEITNDATYTTPVEAEADYYRQQHRPKRPSPNSQSSQTRGISSSDL